VVDDFGVQYTGREHAQHLADTLESLYTITTEWPETRYLGLTLDWNSKDRTVDMSMPGYIAQALIKFQHESPQRPQHVPHAWTARGLSASSCPLSESPPMCWLLPLQVLVVVEGDLLFVLVAVGTDCALVAVVEMLFRVGLALTVRKTF
jgi:hypothetical protein